MTEVGPHLATTSGSSVLGWVPVAWDAARERRGSSPDRDVYRCSVPGCPVASPDLRWLVEHVKACRREADPDKAPVTFSWPIPPPDEAACAQASRDRRAAVARRKTARQAEPQARQVQPRTAKMRRAMAALLRDPRRSNRVIGAEAGASHFTVAQVRHELEDAGLVGTCRARPPGGSGGWAGEQRRSAMTALAADPGRSNREIARDIGVGHMTVSTARRELEASGAIPRWRHKFSPAAAG